MVYSTNYEATHSQVSESFPECVSEFNVYGGSSEDVESFLSKSTADVYAIPTVVSERNGYQDVCRKRPPSADNDSDINSKILKPPEKKCLCLNNENNTEVFPTFEENYGSYSGNFISHNFSPNNIYGDATSYDQNTPMEALFGFGTYWKNTENTETAEKCNTHYISSSIEIINNDTQSEHSEYPFIHTEIGNENHNKNTNTTNKTDRRKHSERRRTIGKSVSYNLEPVMVVWCPLEQLRPDFIVTTLAKYDDDLDIRDRWNFPSLTSSAGVWGGAIAEFVDEDIALTAAKDLQQQSKHVKILKLSWLFNEFINAEIRHPLYHIGTTRIIAKGRKCAADDDMEKESISNMEHMFRQCGDVCHIEFYLDEHDSENVCEVNYIFASQAYLAKFFLTGMIFKPVISLSIEVEETRKEKDILKSVKRKMIEFLEETKCL